MFRCDCCLMSTQPNESCHITVKETRPKVYTQIIIKGMGEQKYEKKIEHHGTEIVHEEKVCVYCVAGQLRPKPKNPMFDPYIRIKIPYDIQHDYSGWYLKKDKKR